MLDSKHILVQPHLVLLNRCQYQSLLSGVKVSSPGVKSFSGIEGSDGRR